MTLRHFCFSISSIRRPPSHPALLRIGGERGAAAVEFAIVLPVLVLILFGIIQFAIAYNRTQGLHAAAREGARVAALPQSTQGDINARVAGALDGVVDPSSVSVSVSPGAGRPCNLRQGQPVTVTLALAHELDIPLWGTQTVNLQGKGEFRCE